ncbi:RNA polymerase sigma factor [Paenibacillus sinopodophylli]|uniref:RNA polymerase sigma factor n=1 Tax=Paenibacillus sinopodophylli TaxID=1837342 RepID=UPI00110CB9D1|nr:RNA polymerase sigma factor [Paenibacillus sinopodophylli]
MAKQTMNDFLRETGTLLYRYLRKRGLSHEDAEDIAQDTCYKFLLHKDGIRAEIVMSWLFRVAANQFYDVKRKEKRQSAIPVDDVPLLSLTNLPESNLMHAEGARHVREVLETLSPLHQELLILKYEMGLSYKQISSLLNKNENTLKTHVGRAKEMFIKNFKEDHYDGQ